MKKILLATGVLLLSVCAMYAQNSGTHLFDNSVLHEVRFEFTESNFLNILTTNFDNATAGSVPYLMAKVTIDGEEVDSVGVRYKGFTSYTSGGAKNPLKIDFNKFVSGKKYDGLKKINLTNGTGDPSMQRDPVCYDLLRHSGVNASRTSFAKVYFNDEYRGVYTIIEQVDKTFLKENFADPEGNLFKNQGWSDLEWLGTSIDSYKEAFDLKTNKEEDDWSGFVHLMDVINNSPDDSFPAAIHEVFDVDLFLKTLAVDVATNNWDSYLEHGRNWYMYEDSVSGIFHWIPWDYNLALGGELGFADPDECFVYAFFYSRTNGTTHVEFINSSFYSGGPTYSWDFGDGATSTVKNPVHTYASAGTYNVCLTATENDTCFNEYCKIIDTNFNPADCAVIADGSCPHPADITFEAVVEFLPSCCSNWGEECENFYEELSSTSPETEFTIDQTGNDRTLIKRLMAIPAYKNSYYNHMCDLLNYTFTEDRVLDLLDHNRELIKDAVQIEPHALYDFAEFWKDIGGEGDTIGLKKIIKDRLSALREELDTVFACPEVDFVSYHDVVINEFVASNDSTSAITDAAGEYDDWIELYNNTGATVDLSDVYLSDDKNALKKWHFPAGTTIGSDEYLIVWADKDEEQEGLHTNFKLSKSGEELVLTNADDSVIDSLTFGEQTTNVAAARLPNGNGDFTFQSPTFGANNGTVDVADFKQFLSVNIYPVPAEDFVFIGVNAYDLSDFGIKVFSSTGQLMLTQNVTGKSIRLNVRNLNSGVYFVQIKDNKGRIGREKLVVTKGFDR